MGRDVEIKDCITQRMCYLEQPGMLKTNHNNTIRYIVPYIELYQKAPTPSFTEMGVSFSIGVFAPASRWVTQKTSGA